MIQQYSKNILSAPRVVFLLAFLLFSGGLLEAQVYMPYWQLAGEEHKRYGVESAKVHYQCSGNSKGTEILVFDHWGWRECRKVDKATTTWGNTAKINSTLLQDGNYSISHMTGSTRARAYQDRQLQESITKGSKAVEILHALEVIKAKGAKKVDTDKILGRKCDVYEIANLSQKIWVWEGLILRTEQKVMDEKIVMVAVKIETDEEFGEQSFALPEGVEIAGLPASAGNE